MSEARLTHAELCARAAQWLRNTRKCLPVFEDAANTACHESPDAIGWCGSGFRTVLIECKVSRADFLRDHKKFFRTDAGMYGLGDEHFYFVEPGIVTVEDIPEQWGLLELRNDRVYVVKPAPRVERTNQSLRQEIKFLRWGVLRAQEAATSTDRSATPDRGR